MELGNGASAIDMDGGVRHFHASEKPGGEKGAHASQRENIPAVTPSFLTAVRRHAASQVSVW